MSFSFSVIGATKEETKAKVTAEMDKVVEQQIYHSRDRDAVVQSASLYIDAVDEREGQVINCYVCGSVSWRYGADGTVDYTQASVQILVGLMNLPPEVEPPQKEVRGENPV